MSDARCQISPADAADAGAVAGLAAGLAQSFAFSRADRSYPALLAGDEACLLLAVDGHERLGYLMGFEHLTFCASGSVAWAGKSSSAPASRPRRRPGTDERVRAVGCRPQLHAGGAGDPAGRALLPRAGYEEFAIYLRKILDDQASE